MHIAKLTMDSTLFVVDSIRARESGWAVVVYGLIDCFLYPALPGGRGTCPYSHTGVIQRACVFQKGGEGDRLLELGR